jgi:hypothetical protein
MNSTLIDGAGPPIPNPAAHGLKGKTWAKVQRYAEELENLWQQQNSLDVVGAKERIRQIEHELAQTRAYALRGGPEPDERPLEEAKKHLDAVRRRRDDIRRAVPYAQEDLRLALAKLDQDGLLEIQAKAQRSLQAAHEAAERLNEHLAEADRLAAVYAWVREGGLNFSPPTPASVTIDNLLYERQRALGLLEGVGAGL